jgi:hypothetical protein
VQASGLGWLVLQVVWHHPRLILMLLLPWLLL